MADNPPNPPPPPNSNPNPNTNPNPNPKSQPSTSNTNPTSQGRVKPPPSTSLKSRLSSSATGLLSSTFAPRAASASSAADIPGTLAAGLAGKSGSRSSGGNHGGSGGVDFARHVGGGSGSSEGGSVSAAPGGGFRSIRRGDLDADADGDVDIMGSGNDVGDGIGIGIGGTIGSSTFAHGDSLLEMEYMQDLEFEALSRSGLQTPVDTDTDKGKGKGKALEVHEKDAFERAWLGPSPSTTSTTGPSAEPDLESDGAAVSSLLSDPAFQPLYSFDMHDDDDDEAFQEQNPYLAPAHPPQTTTTQTTTAQNKDISPLSLIPGLSDLLSSLPALPPSSSSSSSTEIPLTHSDISRLSTLLSSSSSSSSSSAAEAEREGITSEIDADWRFLDTVYHDAVWGNWIEPYVRAAVEEVKEEEREGQEKGGDDERLRDGPAVRRLGLILGHVRARL